MTESRFFKKILTDAEVGKTKTHEVYIRLTNDFDYKTFFQQEGVMNGTVRQIDFSAIDLSIGHEECVINFRFVYYENSNSEKRLPSLASLFESHNIQSGDIIILESRTTNENTVFYFTHCKATDLVLNPSTIYYTERKSVKKNPLESGKHTILQQIYYGAPGTGKSHKIKESICNMPADNVFRTTFHPDSDYSTFVGCYKPTKKRTNVKSQTIVDYSTLVDILRQRINTPAANITKECVTFGYEYHDSIVKMQEDFSHTIPSLIVDAYKSGSTYDTQVRAGMAVFESFATSVSPADTITYSFVPQTFLKAYIRAYETDEPVVLIIEEINRGNCAQIFGDLFQLLDRNEDGCSEYPIKADEDLCTYLKERLGEDSEGIANDELRLPNNLYIWATMNTSDQSLFPIDSAFKRRWDWKYVPIANKDKNYKIEAAGQLYDWWDFLDKVNTAIGELTSSEDKKLGYFFCKADEDNIISADKFVSKVLFYLYNDVLKDYEADDVIFNYKDESYTLLKYQDGDKQSHFKFSQFFDENGDALEDMVAKFLDNINVENSFVDDSSQKSIDGEDGKNDSSLKPKRRKFWQGYIDATKNNTEYLKVYSSDRTAGSQTFMDLAFGKSLYHPYMVCSFDKSLVRCGIWINKSDKTDEVFELFKTNESKMNSLVGTDMVFNKNEKTGSIYTEISINLHDENKWAEAYLWLMNMALKMKDIKDAFGI